MSLELRGVLTAAQLRQTAEHIAADQQPDGLIPWFTGHYGDPWNHIEAAMALTTAGVTEPALRAFEWSARNQRADGSWPMETTGSEITHASGDANQCAYIAVGVWHHFLITRDRAFVDTYWPVVRAAIEYVLDLQRADGAFHWSRDMHGVANPDALLTGSACMVLSLRCAVALAELIGEEQPEWELAAGRLAHSVAVHPQRFADKQVFAMDWYYPVLGTAVSGGQARELLQARWDEFIWPGRGSRCTSDRPWVTGAETCELAIALDATGQRERALELVSDIQFLRAEDGGYWTGWVFPEEVNWPGEKSTWTSAAVILAADVLSETTPAHSLFRGVGLNVLLPASCDDECLALV